MFFFNFDDEPVINNMNSTNLKSITITNLFGRSDVSLKFDKEVNIYIGENGLGKTTILNCVYYVLTKKYDKLFSIVFDEIIVEFKNDSAIYKVNKDDVREYNRGKMPTRHMLHQTSMMEHLVYEYLEEYLDMFSNDEEYIEMCIRKISRKMEVPTPLIRQYVYDYIAKGDSTKIKRKGDKKNIEKLNNAIDKHITQKIIYLTTYRRIENDFSQLMDKSDRFQENDLLIRFGMDDVEKSIKRILNLIRENSRESFNKMTGVLLKQYSSTEIKSSNKDKKIDKEELKIIFDRLGNEIEEKDRNNILTLLDNKEIYKSEYSHLLDLILELIKSYEKYKIYDDKIKNFVYTCNKYLNGKRFEYDQSELKLNIIMEDSYLVDNVIQLSSLSSGEKQIVSLFSRLYLENEKESIVIIDEPELSISMKWQKMLLPDVMRSQNCKLILTVTHSPFIFDNEFDMDAKEMRYCISAHN